LLDSSMPMYVQLMRSWYSSSQLVSLSPSIS